MLMTPDRSEQRPPSAASTSGVDRRIVENKSWRVKIWRIVISFFVLRTLYFVRYFDLTRWSTDRRNAFSLGVSSSISTRSFLTSDCDKSFLTYERRNQ